MENLRKRLVTEGFEITIHGNPREQPPVAKILDRKGEDKLIAMRLGNPPKVFSNWSLRLLAECVIELGLTDSISHETVPKTLEKIS